MKRIPTPFLSAAAILLAATVASAATFRVNDASDAVDLTPGDGVCATAGSVCTLRAARTGGGGQGVRECGHVEEPVVRSRRPIHIRHARRARPLPRAHCAARRAVP